MRPVTGLSQDCHRAVTGLSQGCHRTVTGLSHTHCDIACHTVTLWYKVKVNYIPMFIYSCRWQKDTCQVRGPFWQDLGFREELQLLEWNPSIKLSNNTECCKLGEISLWLCKGVSIWNCARDFVHTVDSSSHESCLIFSLIADLINCQIIPLRSL